MNGHVAEQEGHLVVRKARNTVCPVARSTVFFDYSNGV